MPLAPTFECATDARVSARFSASTEPMSGWARRRAPRRRRPSCRGAHLRHLAAVLQFFHRLGGQDQRSARNPASIREDRLRSVEAQLERRAERALERRPEILQHAFQRERAQDRDGKPCDNLIAFHDPIRIARSRSTPCCSSCRASAHARSTASTLISSATACSPASAATASACVCPRPRRPRRSSPRDNVVPFQPRGLPSSGSGSRSTAQMPSDYEKDLELFRASLEFVGGGPIADALDLGGVSVDPRRQPLGATP